LGLINALTLEQISAGAPLPRYPKLILDGDPHIYLRVNEQSGATVARDFATADGSQPGTYRNDPSLEAPGIILNLGTDDTAVQLDGIDDHVDIMDPADPTAYTIEAWVKPESVANQNILVRTSGAGPTTHWSHQLRINNGKVEHYLYDGGERRVAGITDLVPGEWYHIVGVAENSALMRLYVNGVLEGVPVPIGIMCTGGDRWMLGSNSGHGMSFFSGTLDEVALYNRLLSEDEILSHYEVGRIPEPGMLALLGIGAFVLARRRRRRRQALRHLEQITAPDFLRR